MSLSRREMLAGGLGVAGAAMMTRQAKAEQEDPKIPESAIVLIAQIKAKEAELETVKQALMAMVAPTRKEKGCICYNLHQSKEDQCMFTFYEQWADQEAFDAHGKSPHMGQMRKAIAGKTERGGGVTWLQYLQ